MTETDASARTIRTVRTISLVVAAIALPFALAFAVNSLLDDDEGTASETAPDVSQTLEDVVEFPDLDRNHVEGEVEYGQEPPVGGDHNPVWLNCALYSEPVPNELAVHSLEHGAVWITYDDSVSEADVQTLGTLAGPSEYVLVSPNTEQTSPVVLSAWGKQLSVTEAADPRVLNFVAAYANGPQTPEPGAPCSNGVGG